ncbi:hypothetical protein GQ457_14G019430 [Hibiscus cannabinus]
MLVANEVSFFNVYYTGKYKYVWMITIIVAIWNLWKAQNEIIFNNKVHKMFGLVFFTKIIALFWIKATNFAGLLDESSWWDDPVSSISMLNLSGERLSLSPVGTITVTINGAACHDRAGCGGVLREALGNIRLLFSCPIPTHGLGYTVVMAVFFGLDLFREANWIDKIFLIVELDSSLVLSWINEKSHRPWSWWKVFYVIDRLVA